MLDLRINNFGVEFQTKIGPLPHSDANAISQEKERGSGLGDELKDLLFVLTEGSKLSLIFIYILRAKFTKLSDPPVD